MKLNKKVFLILSLLEVCFSSAGALIPTLPKCVVRADSFPYEQNKRLTLDFTITTVSLSQNVKTIVYITPKGSNQSKLTEYSLETVKRDNSLEHSINIANAFTSGNSFDLTFKLYSSTSTTLMNMITSCTFTIYCKDYDENKNPKIIRPETLVNGSYLGKKNYVNANSTVSDGAYYYGDEFLFSNFNEYYVCDYFYRLDFNDLFFTYKNAFTQNEFIYEEAYFEIKSPKDLFPLLGDKQGDISRFYVDLTIENYEDYAIVKPNLKNKLYVDKRTLSTSTYKRNGYVETNYIYFPRGSFDKEDEYEIKFYINGTTYNSYQIIYTCIYNPDISLIGDCGSSRYCVSTEVNI